MPQPLLSHINARPKAAGSLIERSVLLQFPVAGLVYAGEVKIL